MEKRKMTEKRDEKELESLKVSIGTLREEIAAVAAGLKTLAGTKPAYIDPEREGQAGKEGGPANGAQWDSAWTDFHNTFNEARGQGEKVIKELAGEIKRHPLVYSAAAFGLGFIIVKLWYNESKK